MRLVSRGVFITLLFIALNYSQIFAQRKYFIFFPFFSFLDELSKKLLTQAFFIRATTKLHIFFYLLHIFSLCFSVMLNECQDTKKYYPYLISLCDTYVYYNNINVDSCLSHWVKFNARFLPYYFTCSSFLLYSTITAVRSKLINIFGWYEILLWA